MMQLALHGKRCLHKAPMHVSIHSKYFCCYLKSSDMREIMSKQDGCEIW